MTIKFANTTGQFGTFYTGTPNYVDVGTLTTPTAGMVTFPTKAADTTQPSGIWVDGDIIGVRVYKDADNFQIWTGTWDATNEYIEVETLEDSVGTLSDTDLVTVTGVVTSEMLHSITMEPQVVTITGTTYTTQDKDCGKIHRCTNVAATTVTLSASSRVGWHGLFLFEEAGIVSFARDSTDTINDDTSNVDGAGQFRTAYILQATEGDWKAFT